jgi:hypothetical protein
MLQYLVEFILAPLGKITNNPFKSRDMQPHIPTADRPDLNVGLRYRDSYALPFGRRTHGGVVSKPISKVDSSDQAIQAQSSTV